MTTTGWSACSERKPYLCVFSAMNGTRGSILLQYGSRRSQSVRVRVRGRYSRVYVSNFGDACARATEIAVDNVRDRVHRFRIGSVSRLSTWRSRNQACFTAVKRLHEVHADCRSGNPSSGMGRGRVTAGQNTYGKPPWAEPHGSPVPMDRGLALSAIHLPVRSPSFEAGSRDGQRNTGIVELGCCGGIHWNRSVGPPVTIWNSKLSPQGEWVDLDINCQDGKPEHDMSWNSGFQVAARIDRDRRIWYGAMKIPMSALQAVPPKQGDKFRLNLYRASGPPPETKYVSWQATYRNTFHVPDSFGTLVFDSASK